MYNTFVVDNGAMGRAKIVDFEIEETKRSNPCDKCKFVAGCTANGTDCFAFRRWTHSGDYSDRQVGRLIREFDVA